MKSFAVAALLATAAIASPIAVASPDAEAITLPEAGESLVAFYPTDDSILKRQSGSTETELENGACRRITFIFARGSTEPGNFGTTVGPATCNALKSTYGAANVACQGVGGPYTGALEDNALPQGTTTAAIGEAQRLFRLANTKCPNTIVVAAGYSQGAAVMTAAVGTLGTVIENQIVGVVLYGDTRNLQTGGSIPGYPRDDVLVICNTGDTVCSGTLIVTAAHLAYIPTVPRASAFLNGKINAA